MWQGEFAGKYLTHAVALWKLSPTTPPALQLKQAIEEFVVELANIQTVPCALCLRPVVFAAARYASQSTCMHSFSSAAQIVGAQIYVTPMYCNCANILRGATRQYLLRATSIVYV